MKVVLPGLALALILGEPAWAAQGSQKVHGGELAITVTDVSLPSAMLTGANGTISGASSGTWLIKDARGTGSSWSLSVAASGSLVSAAGVVETTTRSIAISNLAIAPGSMSRSGGSDPTTNISTNAVELTTSSQTIVACSSLCRGRYTFTPTLTLTVPANVFRSNYAGAIGASAFNPYTTTLTYTIS